MPDIGNGHCWRVNWDIAPHPANWESAQTNSQWEPESLLVERAYHNLAGRVIDRERAFSTLSGRLHMHGVAEHDYMKAHMAYL